MALVEIKIVRLALQVLRTRGCLRKIDVRYSAFRNEIITNDTLCVTVYDKILAAKYFTNSIDCENKINVYNKSPLK